MPVQPLSYTTLPGTPQTGQYYHHSGHLNPAGVAAAAVVGTLAAAVLGVAYAYGDKYCPEVHLNGILCIAFGLVLGVVPARILKQFKVRNVPVSLAVVGVVAAVGLYVSWATWESLYLRGHLNNLPRMLGRPDLLVAYGRHLNEVGTWSIGSTTVSSSPGGTPSNNTSGIFLALIWLLEAATVAAAALVVGKAMLGATPFCEACDRWCLGPTQVRTTGLPADPADVRRRLEAGDFAYPATLGPAKPGAKLTFTKHHCPTCDRLNTVTATSQTVTRDRKGRSGQPAMKVLVRKLLVTPADLARLAAPPPPPSLSAAGPV